MSPAKPPKRRSLFGFPRQGVLRQDSTTSRPGLAVLGTDGHSSDSEGFTIGEGITAEKIWSLYEWYPSAQLVDLLSNAVWAAGLRLPNGDDVDVEDKYLYEFMQWTTYRDIFGWAGLLFNGNSDPKAYNPKCNSVGIEVPAFSLKSDPTNADFYNEQGYPRKLLLHNGMETPTPIKEGNFFLMRTRKGLPGWMGLSRLQPIRDVILVQHKIMMEYGYFAATKGRNHRFVRDKLAKNDAERNTTRNKFLQMTENGYDVMVVDEDVNPETDIVDKNQMEGSYDPIPMLTKLDTFICRNLTLPMPFLSGEPQGHSYTDVSSLMAWFAQVRQEQKWILPQIRPVFPRLNIPKDAIFKDPTQMPPEQMATLIKDIAAALLTVQVDKDDLMRVINSLSGFKVKRNEKQYENEMIRPLNTGGTTPVPQKGAGMPVKDSEKGE